MTPSPESEIVTVERVVLDASALLSGRLLQLIAAAALGYYAGSWSSWIVGEVVRKRTEWIAERAVRDGVDKTELRRRLRESRQRVNALVAQLSSVLDSVDYRLAPDADLGWLVDRDDWPVMQTALAAGANTLVTDNSADFPLDQRRNGVLILGSVDFLARLFERTPDAENAVAQYLRGTSAG